MEKTIPVSVSADHVSTDGQMYVRFHNKGSQIHLVLPDNSYNAESPSGFFWTLTQELLPQLPADARVRMPHVVVLEQESQLHFISIEETIWVARDEEQGWFQPHCHLRCEVQRRCYEALSVEDFDQAFRRLALQLPGQLQVCHFCHFADFQSIGGEDLRHGWRCFRDVPPDQWEHHRKWFSSEVYERAIKEVDAFHWCPSFRPRKEID